MHLKRLYIGDFGLFRNQTLEDLSPGMIVIGGRNRAGKSTFGKILKYLGYGFSRGGALPPPHVRYQVEADAAGSGKPDEESENKDSRQGEDEQTVVHIRLDGQAEPVCVRSAGEDSSHGSTVSVRELYPLHAFSYQNLFFISLDQLTKVPEGMNNQEAVRLHSILLGAGLSDLAGIPQMENRFQKEARAIGGKTGSLTNKGFRPYMQQIREGMEQRKQALAQVEEYRDGQKRLSSLQEKLKGQKDRQRLQQANLEILECLKNNYDVFEEVSQTAAALEQQEGKSAAADFPLENRNAVQLQYDRYRELDQQWQEQSIRFCGSRKKGEETGRLTALLLKNRRKLENFHNGLSGLQERWDRCAKLQEKVSEGKDQLLIRMRRFNPVWTEKDLDRILDFSLGVVEESTLAGAVSRWQQAGEQLRQMEYRKDEVRLETERLKKQKAEWKTSLPSANWKVYLLTSLISAVLGIAVYHFHPAAGLFLGLFGIAGSALFVFFKSLGQKEAGVKQKELDSRLSGCMVQEKEWDDKMESQRREQDEAKKTLSAARKELQLPEPAEPEGILDAYRALADLQERVHRYFMDREEWEELSARLYVALTEMETVLTECEECWQSEEEGSLPDGEGHGEQTSADFRLDPIRWQMLRSDLEKWYDRMKQAVALNNLYGEKRHTEETLRRLMMESDKSDEKEPAEKESAGEGRQPGEPEDRDALPQEMESSKSLDQMVEAYLALCAGREEFLALRRKMDSLVHNLNRAASADRLKAAVSLVNPQGRDTVRYFFTCYEQYSSREALHAVYEKKSLEVRGLEEQIELNRETIQKTKSELERLALTSELEQAHNRIQQGRDGLYPVARQYAVWKAAAWLCQDIRSRFMGNKREELLKNADSLLEELTSGEYDRILPNEDLRNPDFSFSLADGSVESSTDVLSRGTREQVFLAVRLGRIMEIKPAMPIILDDSFANFDPLHLERAVSILCRISRTHQIFILTCHPHLIHQIMETGEPCQYWQLEHGQFSRSDGDSLMRHLR